MIGTISGIAILAISMALPQISPSIVDLFIPHDDIGWLGAVLLMYFTLVILIGVIFTIEFIILIAAGALAAKYNASAGKTSGGIALLGGAAGFMAMSIYIIAREILDYLIGLFSITGVSPYYYPSGMIGYVFFCVPSMVIFGFTGGMAGALAYEAVARTISRFR